jgi:CheY-like chemotaxis protein
MAGEPVSAGSHGILSDGVQEICMPEDQSPTLVVVEDDLGHARLIERNLRRAHLPYPIVFLRDGQAALDYLLPAQEAQGTRHPQPYLVLLDLNLPGCPGVEVLARLKRDARTRHIPVVILTTTDDRHEIEECYALGCNAYLTKPVSYDQFVETIQKLGWWLTGIEVPRGSASDMSKEP